MTAQPARSLRALGRAPAPARTPIRVVGSIVFWTLTALGAVAALLPIRSESTPPMLLPAEPSLTFSGYDLASFREVSIDVAGGLEGTLRVVPVDLAVGPDGVREEVDFGSTDLSLAEGLRITPESFDYAPGDAAQRFGFTVVIDPATVDRTRVAGLRFVLQPNADGASVTSVTVPLVAVPGPEDALPTGPPPGRVELTDLDVRQDGAWTLVDRLLPDLPAIVGHAPGVAVAELTGNAVHVMSGATVEIAYDRVNPLSILPFIDDDRSTPFRTTVEEGFLLPGERLGVSADSTSLFGATAPREALPFIGIVRVTATARGTVEGIAQDTASETTTIVVFPWTEVLFLVALGGALRKRRQLLLAREQERFLLEGPRVVLGGLGRGGAAPEVAGPAEPVGVPEYGSGAGQPAAFRPFVVPWPSEEELDLGEPATLEPGTTAPVGPAEEAVGIVREPVVEEPHMPVPWEDERIRPAAFGTGGVSRLRQRQLDRERRRAEEQAARERAKVAAAELSAATAARRAAVGEGIVRGTSSAWAAFAGSVAAIVGGAGRGVVAVVGGIGRGVATIAGGVGRGLAVVVGGVGRGVRSAALGVGRGAASVVLALGRGVVAIAAVFGGAAEAAVSAVGRGIVAVATGLGRGVTGTFRAIGGASVATVAAIGAGSASASRAVVAWRRTRGRDLRMRASGYARATRRGSLAALAFVGRGLLAIVVNLYVGIWWIGRGTELGLGVLWRLSKRAVRATGDGLAATGRAGVAAGGAVLRGSRGLLRAATGLLGTSARASARAGAAAAQASARAGAAAAQATAKAGATVAQVSVKAGSTVVHATEVGAATAGRGAAGLVRASASAIGALVRAVGSAIATSSRLAGRAIRAVAWGVVLSVQALGDVVLAVAGAIRRGAIVATRETRRWLRTNGPAIRRWFAAWGRSARRNALVAVRAVGRGAAATGRTVGRGASVGSRGLGRAGVVASRSFGRASVVAVSALGRASIVFAHATATVASRAVRATRWWMHANAPAIRRWFAAWGRLARRNALVALRASGRGSLVALRFTGRAIRELGWGAIVVVRAIGDATLLLARACRRGAARALRAYRWWARTDLPAIRRWFAAWGRLFRRNGLALARATWAALVWTAGRLGDALGATGRGLRRLGRWWIRRGAPGTARFARRARRATARGLRVAGVGTARWFAGKRRQSVRGWARAKRWTRATLRFVARVARATWAGPLRWSLILLVKAGERLLRWLDRRNDDLPLD